MSIGSWSRKDSLKWRLAATPPAITADRGRKSLQAAIVLLTTVATAVAWKAGPLRPATI